MPIIVQASMTCDNCGAVVEGRIKLLPNPSVPSGHRSGIALHDAGEASITLGQKLACSPSCLAALDEAKAFFDSGKC